MRILNQIIFWILVIAILTLVFGFTYQNFLYSFYFVSFLLPVIIGTSYIYNHFLIPRFLLTKKYLKFGLYCIYALIISMYMEMIVIFAAFALFANYQISNMNPVTGNIFILAVTLYCVVFLNAFLLLVKTYFNDQENIRIIQAEREKFEKGYLLVKTNRQTSKIVFDEIEYIESLGDYIRIISSERERIITREKISKVQKRLPSDFLRIHRSYLINCNKIQSYSKEQVTVNGIELPVSRTYKKEVFLTLSKEKHFISR